MSVLQILLEFHQVLRIRNEEFISEMTVCTLFNIVCFLSSAVVATSKTGVIYSSRTVPKGGGGGGQYCLLWYSVVCVVVKRASHGSIVSV